MKSFLNRLWPWRVILELQSTISKLTAALEKERQLHGDTKSENRAIKGELGIYQERASQHQRDARKMAQIIAIKGGIIGLFLLISLSLVAQPLIRNPVTTNQLGNAINATYFLGWDALLSKPAWLVPVGPAVAQGTNIIITTNAGVVTVNGLTDTNMINVFLAGPTNFALTIGANGTNNDNLHAANNTNFSLLIGANATNNDANSTNFSLLIGSNATNDDQLFGANATNHDWVIGANDTNHDWVIGANDTNQTWLIGANDTNNDTVVSNGVVAHTVAVNGTSGRITSSAGAQSIAGNPAWTLDLATAGTAGTYRSVTTDAYGRVTAGTTPTTFSGYAISDTSANLAAALTDETGVGLAVFSGAPTTTNETIKGDQYGTNAFYIDAKGVTVSNNVNQVKLTNGTVNASAGLLVGTNGFQVTTDGNQNYTGLWDRFVGAGSTLFGVTNSATETMIYSNVVPGHAIGTNGVLKVTVLGQTGWTTPNNATVNIRYGGLGGTIVASFTYGTATTSTLRSEYQMRAIYNQASESSQVSMTATTSTYTDSGGVVTTASFDTSTNFPLTITIKANGSVGTNTILAAEVEIKHKN